MLRFFRRQRQVQEHEVQKLRENFDLATPKSYGVPRNIHRLTVDSVLGLIAVITKKGCVELYDENGNKKVFQKKLGSSSSFFEFVEAEHLLLIICATSTSRGLPESYHLLDTDEMVDCSTTCRPSYLAQAKCFTLARLPDYTKTVLITGNSNGDVYLAELSKNNSQLEFSVLVKMPTLVPTMFLDRLTQFTCIRASRNFLFCCFQSSFVVVLCAKTRRTLQTIEFPFKFTAISISEALQSVFFVSTDMFCRFSLIDLKMISSKVIANNFEPTVFYEVIISARTNSPVLLYTSGIPEWAIRRSSSLTLYTQQKTIVFSMASELRNVRVLYERKTSKRATAIILLCEHEVIAIDLMDEQFRCISLNFLQCVDSSSVTTIRLQTVDNKKFFQQSEDWQYSPRTALFSEGKERLPKSKSSLIFTGHQNGDIFVWDLTDDGQHLLQTYKTTNYLKANEEKCLDESLDSDELEVKDTPEFTCTQKNYQLFSSKEDLVSDLNKISWIKSPAELWRDVKSLNFLEVGLYDDRCEDDRLAVESFYYCDQQKLLACGLYGGMVLVLSVSDENTSNDQSTKYELWFVNAKMSDVDQTTTSQDALKIQSSIHWSQSIFRPRPGILCVSPQTPVRAISISYHSGLVAAGYSTGIVLFDPSIAQVVHTHNFLNPHGVQKVLAGEKPLNRLKTMKQTVRKTFRGRSLRMSRVGNQRASERQVEFRDTKQPSQSGIRCVFFHENIDERSLLFAGTSNSVIYMFEIENDDLCYLCKEIRLSHSAPVIDINFIRLDNQTRMFVFTEEQVRCFVVENFRSARFSYKLTAKCGLRVKRANVVTLLNGQHYNYLNLICNDGSLIAMSTCDQQVRAYKKIMESDDPIGMRLSAIGNVGDVAFVGEGGSTLFYFPSKNL